MSEQKDKDIFNDKPKGHSQNNSCTVKPISKQSSYDRKNKKSINRKRRLRYKQTHDKIGKNKRKNQKPNDIKNGSFSSKIDSLNRLYNSLNKDLNGTETESKPIMSFNDLINFARNKLEKKRKGLLYTAPKPTRFFVLPEIVFYVGYFRSASFSDLEHYTKEKISKKQLKRDMQQLVKLKWIVPYGSGGAITYRPNPFLEALRDIDETYLLLGEYSRLQIDFFDLLNLPLLNDVKSGEKIVSAKVEFHIFEMGSHAQWVRAFFEGLVSIILTSENGIKYESFFPVNKHGSSKIVGYDSETKKRMTIPYGFYHHTIPLKWSLFDIKESSEFSKKGRKSRWAKEVEEYIYIHFDNSIKVIYNNMEDKKTKRVKEKDVFLQQQYLTFGKPFEKLLKDTWSKKDASCQYVEVSDFETLQRLFTYRFIDGKRQLDLFNALEIKTKKVNPYT
jgi:hypothetical protein